MDSMPKAASLSEQSEALLLDTVPALSKSTNREICTFLGNDVKIKGTSKNEDWTSDLENGTVAILKIPNETDIPVSKRKKIYFNKHLIPLRVALFLWFGAGRLPGTFLALFMKQRGMSLIQFSSVFSITFLFQFLSASISGIVADKIGNAKPVLMFHMLGTLSVIICMILAPSINPEFCNKQKMNETCQNVTAKYLAFCNFSSLENYTASITFQELNREIGNLTYFKSISNVSEGFVDGNGNYENFSLITEFDDICDQLYDTCGKFCSNESEYNCFNEKKFVIIYSILILCFFTFWSTVYRFMDIISMALATQHESTLGDERLFGISGEFFVCCLAAFVLNARAVVVNNYDSVFCVSATSIFLSFIAVCSIKLRIKPPGKRMGKKALKLIKHADIMAFLAVVFVAGNTFCFSINFNLYFLESLGAPKILLGLHTAFFSFYGLLLLWTSKWWLEKLGTTKIFVLSLLSYTVSEFVYSFLYNPWLSLIIEIGSAFSYQILWVAVIVHCHKVAPEGLVATVNAVAGAIHFGIGRSTGILGGGLLINSLGQRSTYQIFATICFFTGLLYSMFIYKRHASGKKSVKKMVKEQRREKKSRNKESSFQ